MTHVFKQVLAGLPCAAATSLAGFYKGFDALAGLAVLKVGPDGGKLTVAGGRAGGGVGSSPWLEVGPGRGGSPWLPGAVPSLGY